MPRTRSPRNAPAFKPGLPTTPHDLGRQPTDRIAAADPQASRDAPDKIAA
jgi:hypothetical protein